MTSVARGCAHSPMENPGGLGWVLAQKEVQEGCRPPPGKAGRREPVLPANTSGGQQRPQNA